jgi:hypothetical protein
MDIANDTQEAEEWVTDTIRDDLEDQSTIISKVPWSCSRWSKEATTYINVDAGHHVTLGGVCHVGVA